LVVLLASVFAGSGCTSDAELTVSLRTDLAPGFEFQSVRSELFRSDGSDPRMAIQNVGPTSDLIAGETIATFGGLEDGSYVLTTTLRDALGATTLERLTRIEVSGATGVTVLMTRDCRGFVCPGSSGSGEACFAERCVDAECSSESSDLCGEPECSADTDCEGLAACSEARCLDGACFYARRDSDCAADEWCNVDVGCVPQTTGPADGGVDGGDGGMDSGCVPPMADCDGDMRNGCETDTSLSERNCGGCGIACDPGDLCEDSLCAPGPVAEITAGRNHTCARDLGGRIRCWGANAFGQLGDGTTTTSDTPVVVMGLTETVSVSAGTRHTCAVTVSGELHCWGDNAAGQLGDETMTSSSTPVRGGMIAGPYEDVGVGEDHSCAIQSADGTTWCFGSNDRSQLGYGRAGTASEPPVSDFDISPSPIRDMVQVSSSFKRSCAATRSDSLVCWGANDHARTAYDDARIVATGETHTCVVRADARVVCAGSGTDGRLGHGSTGDAAFSEGREVLDEATMMEVTGAVDVATLYRGGCAALGGGGAVCWGSGERGALGNGSTAMATSAVPVTDLTDVTDVAGGEDYACALTSAGEVFCWGRNEMGQLGDGSRADRMTPVAVSGI
jgi:alpha-tubulin suppressor-like RCC1 family protein